MPPWAAISLSVAQQWDDTQIDDEQQCGESAVDGIISLTQDISEIGEAIIKSIWVLGSKNALII